MNFENLITKVLIVLNLFYNYYDYADYSSRQMEMKAILRHRPL